MKKLVVLFLLGLVSFTSQAQKVKIKKGVVTVDGVEYARFEKDPAVRGNRLIKNTEGILLFNCVLRSYNDPNHITEHNPKGMVSYWEVTDSGTGEIYFEYQGFPKVLFKSMYIEKVITVEGGLDKDNLAKLSMKYGMEHSRNRRNPK